MSLADELAKEDQPPPCRTCDWYDQLNDKDRADFDAWVSAGKSAAGLLRACKRMGLSAGKSQFQAHLKGHHGSR